MNLCVGENKTSYSLSHWVGEIDVEVQFRLSWNSWSENDLKCGAFEWCNVPFSNLKMLTHRAYKCLYRVVNVIKTNVTCVTS